MSDFHSRLLKRFKKEPALDLDYDSARSTECLGNFPHNISE
jgi:hypothetical protein